MTFEKKLTELQTLIEQLETGEQPLDKSIETFQKGQILLKDCRTYLEEAEMKVQKIISETGETEDFKAS